MLSSEYFQITLEEENGEKNNKISLQIYTPNIDTHLNIHTHTYIHVNKLK